MVSGFRTNFIPLKIASPVRRGGEHMYFAENEGWISSNNVELIKASSCTETSQYPGIWIKFLQTDVFSYRKK